jgi:GT2 family glycosyltransferase
LGYQYVNPATPYLYVLDADMVMEAGFLEKALAVLESDPELAGVCGRLVDSRILNSHDRRRLETANKQQTDLYVDEMGGGGLYRAIAIQNVGYLAHRWLPAYEEFELGARLRSAGWKMKRVRDVSVVHEGHPETDLMTFLRLWNNGRAKAGGRLIRSSLGKAWLGRVLKKQAYIFIAPAFYFVSLVFSVAMFSSILACLPSLLLAALFLFVLLLVRKRSLSSALYSFVAWHFYGVASFIGFLAVVGDPLDRIDSQVISR